MVYQDQVKDQELDLSFSSLKKKNYFRIKHERNSHAVVVGSNEVVLVVDDVLLSVFVTFENEFSELIDTSEKQKNNKNPN